MARDPLPWVAATIRLLSKRCDKLGRGSQRLCLDELIVHSVRSFPVYPPGVFIYDDASIPPVDHSLQAAHQIDAVLHALQPTVCGAEPFRLNPQATCFVPGASLDDRISDETPEALIAPVVQLETKDLDGEVLNNEYVPTPDNFSHLSENKVHFEEIVPDDSFIPTMPSSACASVAFAPITNENKVQENVLDESFISNLPSSTLSSTPSPRAVSVPASVDDDLRDDRFPNQFLDFCVSLRNLRMIWYEKEIAALYIYMCDSDDDDHDTDDHALQFEYGDALASDHACASCAELEEEIKMRLEIQAENLDDLSDEIQKLDNQFDKRLLALRSDCLEKTDEVVMVYKADCAERLWKATQNMNEVVLKINDKQSDALAVQLRNFMEEILLLQNAVTEIGKVVGKIGMKVNNG